MILLFFTRVTTTLLCFTLASCYTCDYKKGESAIEIAMTKVQAGNYLVKLSPKGIIQIVGGDLNYAGGVVSYRNQDVLKKDGEMFSILNREEGECEDTFFEKSSVSITIYPRTLNMKKVAKNNIWTYGNVLISGPICSAFLLYDSEQNFLLESNDSQSFSISLNEKIYLTCKDSLITIMKHDNEYDVHLRKRKPLFKKENGSVKLLYIDDNSKKTQMIWPEKKYEAIPTEIYNDNRLIGFPAGDCIQKHSTTEYFSGEMNFISKGKLMFGNVREKSYLYVTKDSGISFEYMENSEWKKISLDKNSNGKIGEFSYILTENPSYLEIKYKENIILLGDQNLKNYVVCPRYVVPHHEKKQFYIKDAYFDGERLFMKIRGVYLDVNDARSNEIFFSDGKVWNLTEVTFGKPSIEILYHRIPKDNTTCETKELQEIKI